jgi:hypothetical protein
MITALRSVAIAACVTALGTSALAAPSAPITPVSNCSFGDVSGGGVTVNGCSGYYVGNLNNGADFADVKALLEAEFAGASLGSGIIEQIDVGTSPVNLAAPLSGQTVIGVHWGGGQGGGNTAFYWLTIGDGYSGLDIVEPNPARGFGGLSNVALYATTPVPEPQTYALLIAGLGAVGFMARRRRSR